MLARAAGLPGVLAHVPASRRALCVGLSLAFTAALVALDVGLPDIELAPLLIVPAGLLALALEVPLLLAACAGLGFIGIVADHWPHRVVADPWTYGSALALGASYALAGMLFRFAVLTWQRSTALDTAVGDAQRSAVAAFSDQLPCGHGWKLETIQLAGDRAVPCVASAYDGPYGLEVIVAATERRDVHAAMALAALRAALPADGVTDARRWLRSAHRRIHTLLRHTGQGCTAWAARLTDGGDVRFASAGFAPVAIVRPEGVYRTAGGGGSSLGVDESPTILDGFSRFDSGDVLVVADARLAELLRRDAIVLWSLLAGAANARENATAQLQGAGGFLLVARRVRGRDESDIDFAARLLDRLAKSRQS